jgi:pimeloyl-ACP methyl ester carboxylesterase
MSPAAGAHDLEAASFTVTGGARLAGESSGEGIPIVLAHGLTATRRYVVHGSKVLPRKGFCTIAYDARGHGQSDSPPAGEGYSYAELSADLGRVIEAETQGAPYVLAGHSMGAHTLTAHALANPRRVAAIIVIGPVFTGSPSMGESLAYWDRLADGLETGGVDGFLEAYDQGLDPDWRETMLRIARERLRLHREPGAIAQALREVPRSSPFDALSELELCEIPALVVASHDDADPGHPYAVAAEWAERLPHAKLISEDEGASPLAWQGGKLSREIAAFCERDEVKQRLER